MMLTIELPLPCKELHAHAKGNRWSKSKATKASRELACAIGLQALGRLRKCKEPMEIEYRFFVPDDRVRDEVNLLQACKPYIDGLCDCGVIYKDDWKNLHLIGIYVGVDKANPRVEISVIKMEADCRPE
jgi:hypothetical protein